MKHLKLVLVLALAICAIPSVNAQTKKDSIAKHQHTMVYQCPMKCEGDKTYDKAGKCPKCNMALKPVAKEHATAANFQCPMKCEGEKMYAKAGKCPVCNMNLKQVNNKAVATNFQCPMKCEGEKIYAMAGKCPKCNMNLKEVTAKVSDDHKGHNHK